MGQPQKNADRATRFGFSLVSIPRGDGFSTAYRFICVECGQHLDLIAPKSGDGRVDPDHVATRARRQNWNVQPWKKNFCWCPACNNRTKKPSLEPKKEGPVMAQTPTTPASAPGLPKEITPAQRQRIRALLDNHFDDAVGAYEKEWSDQRIAEELNVPRIHVEKMREAAYGPILVNPAFVVLQEALAAVDRDRNTLQTQIGLLDSKIDALREDLKKAMTKG